MITAVVQHPPLAATEGGTSRISAIIEHLQRTDPKFRLHCVRREPAASESGSRLLSRLVGPFVVVAMVVRVLASRNQLIMFSAPAWPFFESPSRIDRWLSSLFMRLLRTGTRITGQRLVLNMHDVRSLQMVDLEIPIDDKALGIFRDLEQLSFAVSDFVLSPEGEWPNYIVENYAVTREQLIAFPNGCVRGDDREPSVELPDGVRFVYAGSMFPPKRGVGALVEQFRQSKNPRNQLLLFGPGGEWVEEAAGGDPRIHSYGSLPVRDCIAALKRCDVALFPYPESFYCSLTATMNKTALYLTTGLPILSTRPRQLAAFIEKHQLGVAAPMAEFAEQIDRLSDDAELRSRCRANVKNLADGYTWDVIIDRAFDEIAARQGIAPLSQRSVTASG